MAATAAQPQPAARTVYPVLATAAAFAVIVSGCGRGGDESPAEPPPPPVEESSDVDTAADPAGTPSGEFPDTVREYAEAAVGAWAAPDLIRFAELTTPTVQNEIIELPDPPDPDWSFIRCGAKVTSSLCTFYNRDGDHLEFSIAHWRLGGPEAVVRASFDPIGFPEDPADYAEAYITGWLTGNAARVERLAIPEANAALDPLDTGLTDTGYSVGDPDDQTVPVVVTLTGDTPDPGTADPGASPTPGTTPDPTGTEPVEVELEINLSLLGDTLAIRQASLRDPA